MKKIQVTLKYDESLEKWLEGHHSDVLEYRVISRSLDARHANHGRVPQIHYQLHVRTQGDGPFDQKQSFPHLGSFPERPIIVGAGPAGLFCALRLAEYGVPSLILERGDEAKKRMLKIAAFWRYGKMDPESNVCYGEGGAGLYSDGKLITRIKSPYVQYVMDKLVELGAPPEISYTSDPHLGSNKIRKMIESITQSLLKSQVQIRYRTRVEEVLFKDSKVVGVRLESGEEIKSPHVILATGHSAHETYHQLRSAGVAMAAKDFALGVRIEHPRKLINQLQFGSFAEDPKLGAARYRLSYFNSESKRGTYSFCMCPGGNVLSSGTDVDGIVVNGMSNSAKNSPWSNSALVITTCKEEGADLFAGLNLQKEVEKKAYQLSATKASGRELPAMTLEDFFAGKVSTKKLPVNSTPSGTVATGLFEILPKFVTDHLKVALEEFNKNLPGITDHKTLLMAPETRTSAPVTILRNKETLESTSHEGLYPCGEGAGHAGGITSAAVDGVKVAMSLLQKVKLYQEADSLNKQP